MSQFFNSSIREQLKRFRFDNNIFYVLAIKKIKLRHKFKKIMLIYLVY